MTSYCTYAEIVALTGTTFPQATVESFIAAADRRVNAKLKARGYAANYSAEELVTAGIALTKVNLITRCRLDGSFPSSLTIPNGPTLSDNKDNMIKQLEAEADEQIQNYIQYSSSATGSQFEEAARSDANAEYRLDQSDPVEYPDTETI